ncbi:MAG: hypothetical protein U1E46_15065 [Hyphomicrobiales bacterium]
MANTRMNERRSGGRGNTGPIIEEILKITSSFATRRTAGADQLEALAESTRGLASSFEDLPALQEQVQTVADRMDEWAEYIRDSDMRDMATDARDFVYEHPYTTVAIALVGGVAIGGYIRARAREEERRQRERRAVGVRRNAGRSGQRGGQQAMGGLGADAA